jgi:hypothetical protein
LKDGNKNQIQSKIKDLENIFTPISQNAYKKNDTSQNDASADSTNTSHSNSTSTNNEDSEVVDAECEEIDESSKK